MEAQKLLLYWFKSTHTDAGAGKQKEEREEETTSREHAGGGGRVLRMLTHADVCGHMLTYADVC